MTKSTVTPVIFSMKFLAFTFLGANFLGPNSGCHCENQSVLGFDSSISTISVKVLDLEQLIILFFL